MSVERQALGRAGEAAALRWYLDRGYVLEARNWRCRVGEIDLVVADDRTLVFCEVKTRSSSAWGGGFAAVDAGKQRRYRSLASQFLASGTSRRDDVRFDVASVTPRGDRFHVDVLVGAF